MTKLEELVEVLVCPITKGPVILDKENNQIISEKASLAFPIKEGIPMMLESYAIKIK